MKTAIIFIVSTHSHPKVAAYGDISSERAIVSFNTQPPEGGCVGIPVVTYSFDGFNTQPPEGGCFMGRVPRQSRFGFNTQPPEGGC